MENEAYWSMFLPTLLDRISFRMHKDLTESVKEYGLNSYHVSYIMALYLHEGQTMTGLSKFLDIDNANTHRVIRILKQKGIVYDDRTEPKSKKYHIYLTDYGKSIAEKVSDVIDSANREYFSELTEEESIVAMSAMRKLIGKVMQEPPQPEMPRVPYFVRMANDAVKGND